MSATASAPRNPPFFRARTTSTSASWAAWHDETVEFDGLVDLVVNGAPLQVGVGEAMER